MRDARFAGGIVLCQLCCRVKLGRRGVTRRVAQALEGERHGAQFRVLVRRDVLFEPAAVFQLVGVAPRTALCFYACLWLRGQRRWHKRGAHAVKLGLRNGVRRAVLCDDLLVLGFHFVPEALPLGLHQNLDARLVHVVAPAPAVVDAHQCFEVIEDLVPGQKLAQRAGNDGSATHAAARQHLEADAAVIRAQHMQADVVPGGGGAVFTRTGDGDLELARQVGKLGVQRAPLAHDLGKRPRVGNLVGGNAGALVTGDIANAVAAGLDAVHIDRGQQVHHIGTVGERNPVELQVLARREVAIAGGERGGAERRLFFLGAVVNLLARLVVVARYFGQHAQLGAGELAIGHGHAQHGCVTLHVPAVLQAQRAKVVVTELAAQVAFKLVTVLRSALPDEMAVEFCVLVHSCGDSKGWTLDCKLHSCDVYMLTEHIDA